MVEARRSRPPIGVSFIHYYLPGFIDVPENSILIVQSEDLEGVIHVLEHLRPLVLTDYSNELVCREVPGGGRHTDIAKPIEAMDINSIAIDGQGHEGRTAPTVVVEHDARGKAACQDLVTELLIGVEYSSEKERDNLNAHRDLVNRFLGVYRYVVSDARVELRDFFPTEANPLRAGYHCYSSRQLQLDFVSRITEARPRSLRISVAGCGRGARALQDHELSPRETIERAHTIGGYLLHGFKITENILEIERLAELAFVGERPRAAIIEAVAILELAILEQSRRKRGSLRTLGVPLKESPEVDLKFIFGPMLASLLSLYEDPKDEFMRRAAETRQLRNRIAHHGYRPTKDEANTVLSFARALLSVLELPDRFRPNYKLKKPLQDPVAELLKEHR